MTRPLPFLSCIAIFIASTAALAQTQPARPTGNLQPIIEPGERAPGPAAQPVLPPMPQAPDWATRMTPDEQKWINDVLQYWESRSSKVKVFECKFQKWDYENGWLNPVNGQRRERTYAEGTIKYAQPDKGLFRVEKLISILPPNQPGGDAQQVQQAPELGEHWICDGEKIYSFEANKKQVTVTPLPPQMRGQAIADGPLPFMFGARAETIKARYWVHGLPDGPKGKYWLEAAPKSREDAQNFKSIRIVLDQQDYLPESLQIFAPNYDPPRNDARQSYVFSKRDAQDQESINNLIAKGLDPLGLIRRDFFNPRIPAGWKKVEQNAAANIPAGPPPPVQQAAPPARPTGTVR